MKKKIVYTLAGFLFVSVFCIFLSKEVKAEGDPRLALCQYWCSPSTVSCLIHVGFEGGTTGWLNCPGFIWQE